MRRRLCALSVDLDETPNYFGIHGLPDPLPSERAAHAGYDVGLLRLASFADASRLPVTLFAIGEDLERGENAKTLGALARRGHAVENHSLHHRYDLTRISVDEITREVELGAQAIERATGARPTGFRAPGYTITDAVFDALEKVGVAWDSSVFPCPAYYGAKAAALGNIHLRGRTSRSVLDTPCVLAAPTRPYRPGRPWFRRGKRPIVELPIQVTPGLRLPFFGTMLGVAGPEGAARLASRCVGEELVNIELHLMDFLDRSDGLEALAPHQFELRIPLARRIDALDAALSVLRAAGYAFVRLDEAAARF